MLGKVFICYNYTTNNNGHWVEIRYVVPTNVWLRTARRGRQARSLRVYFFILVKSFKNPLCIKVTIQTILG